MLIADGIFWQILSLFFVECAKKFDGVYSTEYGESREHFVYAFVMFEMSDRDSSPLPFSKQV